MYRLGDRAQAFLPGNRKLPDYMKDERDICLFEHTDWYVILSFSHDCRAAWVHVCPGFLFSDYWKQPEWFKQITGI